MAYYTYMDHLLLDAVKDSSCVVETIFSSVDTELGITYRVVFYPECGFIAAGVHYNKLGYMTQVEYSWETSND